MTMIVKKKKITWPNLPLICIVGDQFVICACEWGDKFGTDHCIIWSICHSGNWSHKFCIDPEGVAGYRWAKCPNLSVTSTNVMLEFKLWYNYILFVVFLSYNFTAGTTSTSNYGTGAVKNISHSPRFFVHCALCTVQCSVMLHSVCERMWVYCAVVCLSQGLINTPLMRQTTIKQRSD